MDNLILKNLQILITEEDLQTRIKELADQINKDYEGQEITLISVLKGSVIFAADLIRHIKVPVQVEFIRLSSYGNEVRSSGKVKAIDLTLPNLNGKNVLVIEKETFGSKDLGIMLMELERAGETPTEIELVGLCTDICVISNAILVKAFLPEVPVTVDSSCCAGVTPESHNNALEAMKMCQIKIK